MKKLNPEFLLNLAIFFGGLIFGLICTHIYEATLKPEINISDLFGLVLTSIVGIYLGNTIQKQQSSSRFEKEYLISELKNIIQKIEQNQFFKNFNNIDFNVSKSEFQELNIIITNFENIVLESTISDKINFKELRNSFSIFRKSILNISPTIGLLMILTTNTQKTAINKAYKNFRKELFKKIVEINNK